MGEDIVAQLVEFAIDTKYESIPKKTVEFAKLLTLKTVAGMVAGSDRSSGAKMAGIIRDQKLPQEVSVLGNGFKTSLWQGVFLNAYFAHASELEDDRFADGVSWDITVIPQLFPLAEKLGLSGKAMMEALIVGLEIHTRTCMFSPKHLGHLVVPGAVGPAIAAAKALGLGPEAMAAAVGLAMSGVPLLIQSFGTDAHFLESAFQSLQGMISAYMAKVGLRGNPDIAKYLSDYIGKGRVSPEKMVQDLGRRWLLQEIWIKKYPVCFVQHQLIDTVIELKREHALSYEDVQVIEVRARPGDEVCNRPEPKTEGDLQFSFQHSLSVALLDGDVALERITEEALSDLKLKEARAKVRFIEPSDQSSGYQLAMGRPACLVIKMRDGREFIKERLYPIGHPKDPLTLDQFKLLYSKITRGILSKESISKTTEMILNLEELNDIRKLTNLLQKGEGHV